MGVVTAAGEEADHLLDARVVVPQTAGCGECDMCRRGWLHACAEILWPGQNTAGALSGTVETRARYVTPLAGELDVPGPTAALIAREAADAYALCARAGVGPGDRVVVCGPGPIRALTEQIVRLRGAQLVEPSPKAPPRFILCAADDGSGIGEALAAAGPGTTVVTLARPTLHGPDAEATARLARLGGALIGLPAAHPDLIPEVCALVVKGELDLESIATVWQPPGPPLDHAAELTRRASEARQVDRALVVATDS